jgi:ADP-ribosylglycohydrolase
MNSNINYITTTDRLTGAILGMFIGDALAMPVHWYYNTDALEKDYGKVTGYLRPRNPHPDSILWRSAYAPTSPAADILHGQAKYWGRRDIHYHQFLQAGENTLNIKLASELLVLLKERGSYSVEAWLERFITFMTTAGNHNDTYAEEYLRYFFSNYGRGMEPLVCGRNDEKHIGGFSLMLPLLFVFSSNPAYAKAVALEHLALTHGGSIMRKWGELLCDILLELMEGRSVEQSLRKGCSVSPLNLDLQSLQALVDYPDTVVVGKHFSSACYVDQSMPATLYLALKYQYLPEEGLIANTMCGGDNVGRGVVLGALLGAVNGIQGWPGLWLDGLLAPPPIFTLEPKNTDLNDPVTNVTAEEVRDNGL